MSFNLNDYEEVKDRLPRFWADHPKGSVRTELIREDGQTVVFKAWLEDEGGRVIADGHAHEVHGTGTVNKTSAVENCETSAIGRALANGNYASGPNRPSREEMAKVNRSGGTSTREGEATGGTGPSTTKPPAGPRLATDKQRRLLENLIETHTVPDGCSWPLAEDLTMRDASGYIDALKKLEPVTTERKNTLRGEVVPDVVANKILDALGEEVF